MIPFGQWANGDTPPYNMLSSTNKNSMRYYDSDNERLIYVYQQANQTFWDDQWQPEQIDRTRLLATKRTFILPITQKYLSPTAGAVLEGGCGQGLHVAALQNNGYNCIGVDFAPRTIQTLNELVPELDIRYGDVRNLPFPDGAFAGYWSLGVIEHFWDGYDPIAFEMKRVLQPGGILFLTFPYLSPLRRWKIRRNAYPVWEGKAAPDNFYQFALDHHQVGSYFGSLGFELIGMRPFDGIKGLKDELGKGKTFLQKWYNYRGKSRAIRGGRYLFSQFASLVAGHSVLLTLRRGSK
jgi:SAM-dependent methyltransferase